MKFDKAAVQTILRGQQNIDRMRIEVSQLISMLIGMVHPDERNRVAWYRSVMQVPSEVFKTEDGPCYWRLNVSDHKIEAWFFFEGERDPVYKFEGWWKNPKYVGLVHAQLPQLLSLFVLTFPSLEERLQPFIKASEVKS